MSKNSKFYKVNSKGGCLNGVYNAIKNQTNEKDAKNVFAKAFEAVKNSIKSYNMAFGEGDVGKYGSGLVSKKSSNVATPGTNALMYGRVQSGKTNTSILTVALAHINSFRCFVILTSDNTWLGKQTADRFRDQLNAGAGPVVKNWIDWSKDPSGFANEYKDYLTDTGLVLVCTKNKKNLENLITVLNLISADSVPGMILDDEADNASLNTNEAKMAKGKTDEPSRIFQCIGQIRAQMPNHIFIQITATPQSLLLLNVNQELKPHWHVLVEPGSKYVGGDKFFKTNKEYLVEVDAEELESLRTGKINPGEKWELPDGLKHALACFIVGVVSREILFAKKEVLSMLIHIDYKKISHKIAESALNQFKKELDKSLRKKLSLTAEQRARRYIKRAHDELSKTFIEIPPFEAVIEKLKDNLRNANTEVIDADNPRRKPEYIDGMNILIGGNRLGRGVTIEGLIITYYGRDAKTKMMDTVHQHARMFGYRKNLLPITRLFSAGHILGSLKNIHDADTGTRELIEKEGPLSIKPVWIGKSLKPTRANVLNPADISAIVGKKRIWPRYINTTRKQFNDSYKKLDVLLKDFPDSQDEYKKIEIELLKEIIEFVPSDESATYGWNKNILLQIMDAYMSSEININKAMINVRRGRNNDLGFDIERRATQSSGYAEGRVITQAENSFTRCPTILFRKQKGEQIKGWEGIPFYAPTLLLPNLKFGFLFSTAA